MPDTSPAEVVAGLHTFGLQRDRFRSAVASAFGLAIKDIDALEYLERYGPQTPRELSARLLLTSGAVTMLVDRLERLNLVRRRAHPTDRRSTLVELASTTDFPDAPEIQAYHQRVQTAAESIPAEQRRHVLRFLAQVADHATTAADELHNRARHTPGSRERRATEPRHC